MILVLGATGTTGGEVARRLIAAGHRPRLLVRDPAKAHEFVGRAEIVQGDLDDRASLARALRGAEKVYLVSAGSEIAELEGHVVDAAVQDGVTHVVKLSVIGADDPELIFSRWHGESERHLMDSGLAWTMLRPINFMSNALQWADSIRAKGEFHQPTAGGRWAAVDPADIGAAAVQALTVPGHEGKAYTLTGPESLDAAGYAGILSKVLGRQVRFVDVPPEAAREAMLGSGIPPVYVEALLDLNAAMKAGKADVVTSGVEAVLGRKPGSFGDWARCHASAFH